MSQFGPAVRKPWWQAVMVAFLTVGCAGTVGNNSNGDGDGDQPSDSDGTDGQGGDGSDGTGGSIFGEGGKGGGKGGSTSEVAFACSDKAIPASAPLRKLTGAQYKNSLSDLLKLALKDDMQVMSVLSNSAVSSALAAYPKDEQEKVPKDKFGSFRQLDQDLQQTHVDASYQVATAVATQLTSVQARLTSTVGACATDGNGANDAQCLTDFIKNFGERALRRPLDDGEVTFYKTFYGTNTAADPLAYADLIAGFLTAPQFLYMVEHGTDAVSGKANVFKLSDFELASRLSYHFWGTMPDDNLFQAAKSGMLKTPSVYKQQVERLASDSRARGQMDEFFYDYFKLFPSDIRDLDKLSAKASDPVYKAFAGGDMPTMNLGRNMANEMTDMARYYAWEKGGKFGDMLTTEYSFAKTSDLAKIYGLPTWNGSAEPPKFPGGQRPGFMTRAAFLSTGLVTTRPIIKGVNIREHVLCDEIPVPPANAAANANIDTSNKTTREAVEAISEQDGTACAGCHKTLINPLGFPSESFDSLGRFRTMEKQFDGTGKVTGERPVNTKSMPQVMDSDMTEVDGVSGMVDLIAKSGKGEACFARNYFRYTFARWENLEADGCALERLRDKAQNAPLADMLREAALLPEFTTRNFQ